MYTRLFMGALVMTSVQVNGMAIGKLSRLQRIAAGVTGVGLSVYDLKHKRQSYGTVQCGPITGAALYWLTKVGLWTCATLTAGAVVKQATGGNTNAATAGLESASNTAAKAVLAPEMVISGKTALDAGIAGAEIMAMRAPILPGTVYAVGAALTNDPKTAPVVLDVAKCMTVNVLQQPETAAIMTTAAMAPAVKKTTVWGCIKGFFRGLTNNIESASQVAKAVGDRLPTP